MTPDLLLVLTMLAVAVALFAIGRPRMDVVAVLVIVVFPLTGVLTVSETLAGFADPNILLIAALFVVGEGLARTGVTYRLGDWLAARAGSSRNGLIALLMVSVAGLGAVMSSTGVVAIFIPVAASLAARLGVSPRRLMMPLSMAALISGMLTLIATAPNLVVDAELARSGHGGFGFFSVTPFGLVVLALGIGYVLVAQRLLGEDGPDAGRRDRDTFGDLLVRYGVEPSTARLRVGRRSPLQGTRLGALELGEPGVFVLGLERRRFWRGTDFLTAPETRVRRRDVLVLEGEPDRAFSAANDLAPVEGEGSGHAFAAYTRQLGMIEVMVPPGSAFVGRTPEELGFPSAYGVAVLGLRQGGRAAGDLASQRIRAGAMLLVAGEWNAIHRLRGASGDFVSMAPPAEGDETAPAADQAPFALLSVVLMVVLMVTGAVPNVIAALIGALLMGLFRAIDLRSAYRAIHWPTLLVIAGMLPFAEALESTGGIDLAVDALISALGGAGPHALLAALFAATAIIGMFVSNTATAVLMAPVAVTVAATLGLSPYPFAMVVMLAASSAFMTPVSSPVNTLVLEPGRYRFVDFLRVGAPFTLVVMVVSVVMVPILLPFTP